MARVLTAAYAPPTSCSRKAKKPVLFFPPRRLNANMRSVCTCILVQIQSLLRSLEMIYLLFQSEECMFFFQCSACVGCHQTLHINASRLIGGSKLPLDSYGPLENVSLPLAPSITYSHINSPPPLCCVMRCRTTSTTALASLSSVQTSAGRPTSPERIWLTT